MLRFVLIANRKKNRDRKELWILSFACHFQELLEKHGIEPFIMGMTSQIAEREDHILVEDVRGMLREWSLFTAGGWCKSENRVH